MSDARWADVFMEIDVATSHFQKAVALHNAGGFDAPGLDGYRANMALMHSLQSAHTALEGALVRVLSILGEEPPTGDRWHEDLIRRASTPFLDPNRGRPAILTADVVQAVNESRRFRHRAVHGYDSFEGNKAEPMIEAAKLLGSALRPEIEKFQAEIDPPDPARTI